MPNENTDASYTAHLIRLVKAMGETLSNHAEEIVGRKTETTNLQIVLTFPQSFDGFPTLTVKQTYLSDEAIKVARDSPYANLLPDIEKTSAPEFRTVTG